MSDYDERDETDRSEDEEERVESEHLVRLRKAKGWIRDNVRKKQLTGEERNRKAKLTEEDVDQFFENFSDLAQEGNRNTPTLLHAVFDLVQYDDDVTIDSVTVKTLVQRLVSQFPLLLSIADARQQNPLYMAITNKKKILADYMVVNCPEDDSARQHLANAIEDCCGNEKNKNCLHLAFEKDMKPSTLLRMLKDAHITSLEAVDTTGRRPMHYAIQYKHCNVEVINAFIAKDNETLRSRGQISSSETYKTFLDVDEESKTSVYQEHVSSALKCEEERNSKRKTLDDRKKREDPLARGENWGKGALRDGDEAARKRNAATQSKSESITNSRFAIRMDQSNSVASRDPRNLQDRSERLRELERERELWKGHDASLADLEHNLELRHPELREKRRAELRTRELGRNSAAREVSRDRQSLGPADSRDALRVQTTSLSTGMVKPSNEVAANTPKVLRRAPTMIGEFTVERPDNRMEQAAVITRKSRKPIDHEAAERVSKVVLRMLKLHYMRTRSVEKATSWLYKTNPTGKDWLNCP